MTMLFGGAPKASAPAPVATTIASDTSEAEKEAKRKRGILARNNRGAQSTMFAGALNSPANVFKPTLGA